MEPATNRERPMSIFPLPAYICECPLDVGEVRLPFLLTDYDGRRCICRYCRGCEELALIDWNKTTASLVAVSEAQAEAYCAGSL